MKKLWITLAIIIGIIAISAGIYFCIIAPSFIGNAGSDGKMLKKYIEPVKLKELTLKPNKNIWIVDVRPRSSWENEHIPTAKSFPSSTIESRLNEITKNKYLIIYCETGGRVQAVISKLKKHGYTRYMNWGGFFRWPYPTAKGKN